MAKRASKDNLSPRILNRRATHDYHIHEKLEVGILLRGSEVKSIRNGQVSLAEGFCIVDPKTRQLYLMNVHIKEYVNAHGPNSHEPVARRKLLAHKREIASLIGTASDGGRTIVPLSMYFNDRGICKVEIAVVSGKKQHDKRQDIARRDADRDMRRAMTRKRL